MTWRRARAVVAAAWLGSLVALLAGPGGAVAASTTATFGTPTATSTYGREIVFEQPVTLSGAVKRVEILVTYPEAPGPAVSEVPASAGVTTLTYHLDTPSGGLSPNSRLTARWRVTWPDGSLQLGPEVSVVYADTRFTWRTREGSLVRIHWYDGPDSFGQRALDIGERAVKDTSQLLGATETEPIDFFVYADQQAFYDALGPDRQNVGGLAILRTRTLFAWITPDTIDDPWVAIVVPHELVHLVTDGVVRNPYHDLPKWLNEGLATWLSQGYDGADRSAVESAARGGSLIPLEGLAAAFPASAERFSLAYAESAAAIDYLVRTYGRDKLVALVRSYANGPSDDEAFSSTLGVDVAGFDAAWRADLHAREPKVYGPQPAPAGPLPPGWAAASPGAGAPSGGPGGPATPTRTPTPGVGTGQGASASGGPNGAVVGLGAVALVVGALGVLLISRDRGRRGRPVHAGPEPSGLAGAPRDVAEPPDDSAEASEATVEAARPEDHAESGARSPWDRPS